MALTNYSFGSNNKDIKFIEHYHEAPFLEPLMKSFILFSEQRNNKARYIISLLEKAENPEIKKRLVAELASFLDSHEQDLALFRHLLENAEQ